MKTALWIIAICELVKLVRGFLGGIAQAELDRRERERKRKFAEQIKEFNRYTESVKRMRDEERRANVNNTGKS